MKLDSGRSAGRVSVIEHVAPADSFVYGPRDVAHTFEVVSPRARFLLVTEPGGFDEFVRALAGRPPEPATMAAVAAEYGIEILGPPGIPS